MSLEGSFDGVYINAVLGDGVMRNELLVLERRLESFLGSGGERTKVGLQLNFMSNVEGNMSAINWHIDEMMKFREEESFVFTLIDGLVYNRKQTDEDLKAGRELDGSRERLLKMHGLGGNSQNLDGRYNFSIDYTKEIVWVEIEFWTAEHRSGRVSIFKGEIHCMSYLPGVSRSEPEAQQITRFSICPYVEG